MSLPDNWTDRIFDKLSVTYGQRFLGLYAGVDMLAVKANWAHELSGFQQHPDAIKHALSNLPLDYPPTVLQFRDLCRRSPNVAPVALPAPPPDPERLGEALKRLGALDVVSRGSLDWARALQVREQNQSRNASGRGALTIFQKHAWREALGFPKNHPCSSAAA